ncbi:SPOSA6832_01896, partial [Sporobolomyces salmonicolor]
MATEDVDYYALLGIEATATLQQIKTAYRQRSLKVHPDRNPDNPEAAALFHELRVAADLLSDPTQRASFDALLAARNARKLRFAALDNKRKAMAEDLAQRERDFKRQKGDEDVAAAKKKSELDRLKEEGRKMREAREKAALGAEDAAKKADKDAERARKVQEARASNGTDVVELGPLDKTLKIKWLKATHPSLTSSGAVSSFIETNLAPQKPDIESIVLSSKTLANPSKGKYGSGVVAFSTLSAALRVVKGKQADSAGSWQGFEVDWASGHPPSLLGEEAAPSAKAARPPSPPITSIPASAFIDSDEDRILAQLRAREREKLMEEMKRQDEAEA